MEALIAVLSDSVIFESETSYEFSAKSPFVAWVNIRVAMHPLSVLEPVEVAHVDNPLILAYQW